MIVNVVILVSPGCQEQPEQDKTTKSSSLLNKGNLMYQGSIKELHQQLVNKERSAVEIAQTTLKQIETVEPKVKAF